MEDNMTIPVTKIDNKQDRPMTLDEKVQLSNRLLIGVETAITNLTKTVSLLISEIIERDIWDNIASDRRIVATAGSSVRLTDTTTPAKKVIITAETDNTGVIVIGGDSVVATLASRKGNPLNAGDSITLYVIDLINIYLDSTVSGDGVTYNYSRRKR